MSKLTFPAVGKPYRGFVDKLRNCLREAATFVQNSPGAASAVSATIGAYVSGAGSAIVADNATVAVKNSAGSKTVTGATIDVASGAVEDVNLPATAALVTNAQALTGVTPSGSYTNTVTFTVAAGVITAIVLS